MIRFHLSDMLSNVGFYAPSNMIKYTFIKPRPPRHVPLYTTVGMRDARVPLKCQRAGFDQRQPADHPHPLPASAQGDHALSPAHPISLANGTGPGSHFLRYWGERRWTSGTSQSTSQVNIPTSTRSEGCPHQAQHDPALRNATQALQSLWPCIAVHR